MKNLVFLLSIILLAGCTAEREFIVDYDYSYRATFRRYKTFSFLDQKDTVSFNGMSDHLIKDEIVRRMGSQGYVFDENRPSILIAYKVFNEDLKLQGYDQLDLVNWENNFGQYEPDDNDLAEIEEAKYHERKVEMKRGTLLIDFIDRRTHSVIWQGYASGLFDDSNLFSKDAKYAVRTILNQYKLLAYNATQ
ncbi:DUF4136 domain-containing protein [Marinoscillum sp. MHG1-6]|uniref:DUF4136 domain-containing protein n=1 Tax=Marinoscillum sp. MHG1-6 TaxID=2959627 RepID=UPI002157D726|nr:DUF4136 domain-containing protein [Marinoscillum sp. MHG1-6]